jgi:predicted CxxxxCH...CXXCH cytochrome family protein
MSRKRSSARRITYAMIIAAALAAAGCSTGNERSVLDPATGEHPAEWIVDHRATFLADPGQCTECHGADLSGGISGVSCYSAGFNGMSCHANGPGHPAGWASPDAHGPAAKSAPNAAQGTGFSSCQTCHGSDFTGGIAKRSCMNTSGCHGANVASPHAPAPWRSTGTATRTHAGTNAANAPVCAQCHANGANSSLQPSPPAAAGTAAGCFNNTLCHGSNVSPHAVPFTDPALHGPVAKADLSFCEGCHAAPSSGGPGSNPRFNVAIGSLSAGCESGGCHGANLAHPGQWRGLTATAPGGHRSAGNMANACALCHGVNLAGGAGPACSTCHTAGSPLTLTNCTSCHGSPPNGAAHPNLAGTHAAHNALPPVKNVCGACHDGGGTGTANHDYGRTSAFMAFPPAYSAKSGAAFYDPGTAACANIACHGSSRTQTQTQAASQQSTPGTTPNWQSGTINVNTQCALCHVLGPSSGNPENNSYYSGEHYLHVWDPNNDPSPKLPCTTCHDIVKLATVHFVSLTGPISSATASATLSSALRFNGTTCNPNAGGFTGCHGSKTW